MERIARAIMAAIVAITVTVSACALAYLVANRAGIIQPADPAAKKQARPF